MIHEKMMKLALKQAEKGIMSTSPNPRVGCVVVKNDRVIASGYHQYAGEEHAEVRALRGELSQYEGSTIYVTLEPCSHFGRTPPCCYRLIKCKPAKVVVAMLDPNPKVAGQGIEAIRKAGIEVEVGCCEAEALQLNAGYIRRMKGLGPRLYAKIATSIDGSMALHTGESKWLTGEASRQDVMRMRGESCAIVTGVNTILNDDAQLNARLRVKNLKQPDIIILDSRLKIPLDSKVITSVSDRRVIILTTSAATNHLKEQKIQDLGVEIIKLREHNGQVCLDSFKQWLATTDYHNIMVESGPTLITRLIETDSLHELIVYQAPILLGKDAINLFGLSISTLSNAPKMTLNHVEKIHDDLKITYALNVD